MSTDSTFKFVPDAQQPQAAGSGFKFVPDATEGQAKTKGSKLKETAAAWGSAAIRPLAKAGIYAATFIPDIATSITNALFAEGEKSSTFRRAEEAVGQKPGQVEEMPSSYFLQMLNAHTQAPKGTLGKAAEEISSLLMSGGTGLEREATEGVEKIAGAAGRAARNLVGHAKVEGITRITTRAAEEAHNVGYSLSPAYVGGPAAKVGQVITGGSKLHDVNSGLNQPVTDRLAKTSIGLHPNEELSDYNLERLKMGAYQSYDRLKGMGNLPPDQMWDTQMKMVGGQFLKRSAGYGGEFRFQKVADEVAKYRNTGAVTAEDSVEEVQALRENAKANFRSANPEDRALGLVQRQIADAIDARLDRRATQLAQQGVLPSGVFQAYKAGREQLAKIHAVEDALGPGGHVMASELAKAQAHKVKLTDGLETIANSYRNFSADMRFLSKGSEGIFSPWDFILGGSGLIYGHPLATTMAVVRPVARIGLTSRLAQKVMVKGAPKTRKVIESTARGAAVRETEQRQERKDQPDAGSGD